MLSALKGLDPAIDSIRHGAFDYIPKPIDLNKLLGSIRSAVEGNSQNRATNENPAPDALRSPYPPTRAGHAPSGCRKGSLTPRPKS